MACDKHEALDVEAEGSDIQCLEADVGEQFVLCL